MIERVDSTPIEEAEVVEEEKREIVSTAPKLDTAQKMKVLAMLARGERYATIQSILKKDHDIDYSINSIRLLKKNHAETIAEMEAMIIEREASEAEQIRVRALASVSRKLDRASKDESELAELDRAYRDGELEIAEYKRRKKGLLDLSVTELLSVSKEMYAQTGKGKNASIAPGSPAGGGEGIANPQTLEVLMDAIKRGDTVTLQQMVINPNA